MIHLVTDDNFSLMSARLEQAYRRRRRDARDHAFRAVSEAVDCEMTIFEEVWRVLDCGEFGVVCLTRLQGRRRVSPRRSRAASIPDSVRGAEAASPDRRDGPSLQRRRAHVTPRRRAPTRMASVLARRIISDMASCGAVGGFGAGRARIDPDSAAQPPPCGARR
jgi:hypothetical protein